MEDFSSLPSQVSGPKESLMRARRQLKRTIADRRDVEADRAEADRMGNPAAIAVLKSGSEHGAVLNRLSTATSGRAEDRRVWQEEEQFAARISELGATSRLRKDADKLYTDTTDVSNAFTGTRNRNDKLVQTFADLHKYVCPLRWLLCCCCLCVFPNVLPCFPVLTLVYRRESKILVQAQTTLQKVDLDAEFARVYGADAVTVDPNDPMVLASQARQVEAEERIGSFAAADRFRAKLRAAQARAKQLRETAIAADTEAIETRTKFLRVAKKMALPARLRANAQVVSKRDEADALAAEGERDRRPAVRFLLVVSRF